jgi:hypothetical protein
MSATSLQNHPSVEELFKHVDTIPLALFEHLDFSFLTDFPVFAPDPWGRTRDHEPPDLLKGVLYCFSREIYSPEEIARELRDELLYLQCGFDNPPSHQSIRRFLTDIALVVDDVFEYLVEQVAARDLLDNTFRIDSTDVRADPRDGEASWNYDPTAEADESDGERSDESDQDTSDGDEKEQDEQGDGGYYFGYGCLVVTTGPKLPVAVAFTDQKQVDKETARRVTQDALAVGDPLWMLGDAAFDMLEWHDDLIEEGVVPIAPYNERNTDDPYDIDYRVEQRIKEHSDTVGVWSKQLEETYEQRSQVERTIGACKDCGLETPGVRGRVRVKSHVFLTLCLRLVIAIANYERGANPGKTTIEVCQ